MVAISTSGLEVAGLDLQDQRGAHRRAGVGHGRLFVRTEWIASSHGGNYKG
jgi:hypothetical protein